ncbi:TonB-dependent receptor [Mucilaginibacter sp. RS28]|uniref:TonB-dependent receptor n=1 Tax=Mucilaginibacter straminoryzae TaxID=2932774 RepID=A0A9X1X5T5_9SPHI|nr:outer membrane beta-barrel family protein [Mucilaginibacter straminoryzae]MCJ8211647.1 TonB-dependent receptor [Mucilaginibacter straminoryzae]
MCTCAFAQPATQVIKGIVTDSLKKQPIGYVTVAVRTAKTDQPVKSTLSKESGSFEFNNLPAKSYKLVLASVGYKNKTIFLDSTKAMIDLGKILLSPASKDLNEVTVTALKPLVKREVDRIAYDVQADPESKATNALEMLRKVPLVSVDGQDQIKLKGNTDYKIFINGKPSALVTQNPSDVLKSMPATNIEKIEVITNPPAKYEAEGLAGIINIITKKNADQGYNGTVTSRYNSVWGPGGNLNATVKQGKFGINGYVGFNSQNKQNTSFNNATYTYAPVVSSLMQNGNRFNQGRNIYSNAELSYEIDTLNLLSGSFNSYKFSFDRNSYQLSFQPGLTPSLNQSYALNNLGNGYFRGTEASLNYQLGFKRNKDQLLTLSYKYSSFGNKQDNQNTFEQKLNYGQPDFNQHNNASSDEQTIQLDYVHPFDKKLTFETGTKAILRKSTSDFNSEVFDKTANAFVPDLTQTNNFDYRQDVYSGYTSLQYKKEKWSAKAGLRLEHTTVDANYTSIGSAANQDYNNLVPNISVMRSFKNNSLSFSFSNRISRPGIWQLNPFVNRANPKYIQVGNPALRPAVNHNFELNYDISGKGSINMGLSYTFANNTIQNVTTIGADTVSVSTYDNVGKNKRVGYSLSVNYPLTKKLSANLNAQLLFIDLKGFYNNIYYHNNGLQGYTFFNASYKFTKTFRMGADVDFDSRYVMLQGRDNSWFGESLSASKDFLNEKATLSLYVSNPFKKFIKIDFYSKTEQFEQFNSFYNYYRNISLSFMYKFGKLNSSIKKNQRGIRNDDTSGGGRGN